MKKILSLVLVLTMVLGSFGFAFAAEEVVPDSVKRVHAAGLFGVGGLELDRIATRAELATLVLRLHGYEDAEIEALQTASDFSDVPATSWYAPYVGLSVQEGLFTGDTGATTFRPLENAKYSELLVVLLRALGYGEDFAGLAWPNGYVLKAAEVGIDVDLTKDVNATVSRLVVGATIDKALDLEVKGGEETLGQKLGLEGFEPVDPEPEELEVVGVSADNTKQVVVEFNQDVTDNEEVENKDNYVLENKDGKKVSEIEDVEIDGELVTLTLVTASSNQVTRVLVIDKNVIGTEVEEEVRFDDFTVPTAEDAEVIGESMIHVVFSEPIKDLEGATKGFEIESADGKTTYRVRSVKPAKNGKEALVELRSTLKDGDEIVLTVKNSLTDYAGFKVATTEFDLEVIEDNSEIEVVGFRKASEEGITLIFNKNIKLADDDEENFYHTNRDNTVDNKGVTPDGNELRLDFETNLLPTGTAYIFIDGGSLEDYWGNDNTQTIRYIAEITADTKEPAIEDITGNEGQRTIIVEFDKRLDKKTATDEDNYEIVHATSGKEAYTVKSAAFVKTNGKDNEKQVKLTLNKTLDAGKYTLEVDGVEDYLGNAEVDTAKDFTVKGNALTDGDVSITVYGTQASGEYTVVVDYDRPMDTDDERYSVLDLANYSVLYKGKSITLEELDDEDDYYVDIDVADDNDEIVEIVIEFPKNTADLVRPGDQDPNYPTTDRATFEISRVKDANGLLSAAASFGPGNTGSTNFAVDTDGVEAISKNEIKITFNKIVDDYDIDDFSFSYDVTNSAGVISTVYKTYRDFAKDYLDDEDVLVIELEDELEFTDTVAANFKLHVSGTIGTKDSYGTPLSSTTEAVVDGIAPEVDEVKTIATTNANATAAIEITFTEDVVALAGNKTFTIDGYTIVDVNALNNKIIIDVKNKDGEAAVPPADTVITVNNVGSDLGIADANEGVRLEADDDFYVGFLK